MIESVLSLIQVESEEQLTEARKLFHEYAAWLAVPLCFQNFDEEVKTLPGKYAPPRGRLLIALGDGEIAGCVALRDLGAGVCEMKRLYVRPEFRGKGIGKALAAKIMEEARSIGYEKMRLDTLSAQMREALTMYRTFGFKEIEPYYHNPVEGALFMEKELR